MTNWQIVGRRPRYPDEAWVKKQVKAMFEALKEAGFGVWFFMPQGSNIGRVGIPDFVGCVEGNMVAVETKKSGGKVSKLQEREIESIVLSEGYIFVADETCLDNLWNKLQTIAQQKYARIAFWHWDLRDDPTFIS